MTELMSLIVGWALVGAFVFTVVITCLSLVGWVELKSKKQQAKLFQVVVLELVVVFGGSLVGVLRLNPAPVRDALKTQGANEEIATALSSALKEVATRGPGITKEEASKQLQRINVARDIQLAPLKDELSATINALPAGTISPAQAKQLSTHGFFQTARPDIK